MKEKDPPVAGMRWTGQPRRWGDWPGLGRYMATLNAEFAPPLGERADRDAAIQVAYAEGQTQQTVAYILNRYRNSL